MKNKTNLIFTHKLITAFADSLVKAFIPLLILKSTGNIFLVMMYLCVYYFLCGVLNLVLKKFLQKYGIIAIVLHAIPLIALQFLFIMEMTWWLILTIALLASLGQVLYSVPLNLLFAFTDKEVNVAKFQIATNLGKIIFILLTGFVLGSSLTNSILLLSILGTALYLLSIIPVIYGYNLLKNAYEKIQLNPPAFEKKSYRFFNVYHIAFALFQSVLDVLIPIFLFVQNLTIDSIAIVMVLIEICKILANLLAKFLLKKEKPFLSIIISICCLTIGSILIMLIKDAIVLYICSCVIAISFPLLFVPMFSAFVKKITLDNNQFNGMSYRDVYIFFGKNIMYIPYFIFPDLIVSFCIGIISAITVGVTSGYILRKRK